MRLIFQVFMFWFVYNLISLAIFMFMAKLPSEAWNVYPYSVLALSFGMVSLSIIMNSRRGEEK
jgi:hypothetical protein